ncbi:type IIA topoisomerase (DNA gyrase/topo II, topoisomerase IV), A subunit [Xenococcus sp. PCC 7305]|uniref:DNA gyrase/topoisomerase IV subunit A n=1 Tax=Xenococcus sp. PCC 7305 TaxID=102125 RepID=UPI0002AC8AE9|nr:DNA topoisomerase (ATP-hydrolyzing) [Xenococcus sp. PCC 7305]ELS05147.1 type IIA topoisomerase (DNA gyrase/topo II, topoisomerase IV), A subunit [Xenococcus sp. PCC 7305]
MAKQLNLLGNGQIIPTALHTEMERSYLEYAMSVIVGRALPDVRDGLKPVHRRILYAMHELGLTPDRPYRKCARVVGDVLGKYHPHGDQSVYDALVRMVQSFSTRYPLLAGHGNFGSVDNDPPAAMRYTETRLAAIAHEGMLSEIDGATVDFSSNFDNSQQEPVVLPVQLPILLLNGCGGIAVGMATNVPPHNLGEVVDGLIALIDKPDLSDEKLWNLIPGPDFPTGGEIVETKGITEAYSMGRGSIKLRGIAKVEKLILRQKKRRKERTAIIVTELPYQVNKAAWIEKVADLVNDGRLEGISDIRDESDRTGMRVVIELKKDVMTQDILQKLYRQTALQHNFGAIMLALVDNTPLQLSLREILNQFLEFRELTLRRQYGQELSDCQQRLHLVAGLLLALDNLDQLVDILRNAPDGSTAKIRMSEDLGVSETQADSILGMPMRRITGLEKEKLAAEQAELQQRIDELETLLGDRHELMKSLKKELRSLKRKYGDERRTRIADRVVLEEAKPQKKGKKKLKKEEQEVTSSPKTLQPSVLKITKEAQATINFTHEGHIYWQNPNDQTPSSWKKGEDFVVRQEIIGDRETIIFITDSGKAYPVAIEEIPHYLENQTQTTIGLLSQAAQRDANKTIEHFFLDPEEKRDLILLTTKGVIKRLAIAELNNLGNRGFVLIKLKEQDHLQYVGFNQEDGEIAIATSTGRILRLPVNEQNIPTMGRNAQGNQGIKLRLEETIVGCANVTDNKNILLVTRLGYSKQFPVNTARLCKRGDLGTYIIPFANKQDYLAGILLAQPESEVILTTNTGKQLVQELEKIEILGKDRKPQKIAKLDAKDAIVNIYLKPAQS